MYVMFNSLVWTACTGVPVPASLLTLPATRWLKIEVTSATAHTAM